MSTSAQARFSRRSENFKASSFQVGAEYTRDEIAQLGQVHPLLNTREWTGIVEFSNCVVLFSTLIKEDFPDEHKYADIFSDDEFKWESQNRNSQQSSVIQRITKRVDPVLLFCRLREKERGKTLPFTFAGRVLALKAERDNPVAVQFSLLDYQPDATSVLRDLYLWRPLEVRKLDPVELPLDRKPERQNGSKGHGRISDPKKRRAIELRAMAYCRQHYENQGFQVLDTSSTEPFDFLVRNQLGNRRGEVKGLSGDLGPIAVTIGEVDAATKDNVPTDLFVLFQIQLEEMAPGVYVGVGGEPHLEQDWKPSSERLRPVQFDYLIKRT